VGLYLNRGQDYTAAEIESISSVLDNFGDYMVVYSCDGDIFYANSNLLVTLDYLKEEIKQ